MPEKLLVTCEDGFARAPKGPRVWGEPTTIIGTGCLGTALAALLARANWDIRGIANRTHSRALTASLLVGCSAFPDPCEPAAGSSFLLLCVPAEQLQEALATVRPVIGPETVVAYTCPEVAPEDLDLDLPLALLPLVWVEDPEQGMLSLPESVFVLEGPGPALERGRRMVEAVGGRPTEGRVLEYGRRLAEVTQNLRRAHALAAGQPGLLEGLPSLLASVLKSQAV